MSDTVLITGAAGAIGTHLRAALARPGRELRLLDLARQPDERPDEHVELVVGSFLDPDVLRRACRDVDVVIHLAGLSTGGFSWEEYLEVNINGTRSVLEAVRAAMVPRVIYASSNHAVGFAPLSKDAPTPDYLFARPDSMYGVSKAASESLCSLYHDRFGLDVICLRIGSFLERPTEQRHLWSWLSPEDCTRLFDAALTVPQPGFRLVWGVSKNSRAAVSLDEGAAIGYVPEDDAEHFASDVSPATDVPVEVLGGPYASPTFE